jgi:Family of unknown function (DUF6529)
MSTSVPSSAPPAAPSVPATPVKRTRPPDNLSWVFLALTAIFGIWGLSLLVLTALAIAQPAFLYSDQKNLLKAMGATAVAVLAVFQVLTMSAAMGTIPRGRIKMKYLMRGHRYGGRIAIALAVAVAFFCIVDRGAATDPFPRVAIHAFFGSTAFAALAVKFSLLRWRPALAYDAAPWLGRYVAVAFIVIWITSAYAYFSGTL